MHPYLPHTENEIKAMLKVIGASDISDLFDDIDHSLLTQSALKIPDSMSENAIKKHFRALGNKNENGFDVNLAGGGMYQHDIPEALKHLVSRSEFYTAYTPYQPEISQGTLQGIYEYQTMICELTGMAASNASHYDGGTATAEAVMMAHKATRRDKIMIATTLDPETQEVIKTYCRFKGIEIIEIPEIAGFIDKDFIQENIDKSIAGVVLQSPNYYGLIEDVLAIEPLVHEFKSLLIVNMNPIAMSVFKSPGEMGADIAVGDGQVLGNAISFGGPSLGFMATNEKLMRKLPGRIVGEAIDRDGKTGYVLTMQAREQHIRRDKATSNITSNQALNALASTIFLSLVGPKGLKEIALKSMANTRYIVDALLKIEGIELVHMGTHFNEYLLYVKDAGKIHRTLAERGVCLGILDERKHTILLSATEIYDRSQLDQTISQVKAVVKEVS